MRAPGFSRRRNLDYIGSAQTGSPLAALVEVETLEDALSSNVALPRFRTFLITCFRLIALLPAVVGVYGVTSFSVGQRFHKFGVRMALGADGPAGAGPQGWGPDGSRRGGPCRETALQPFW